MTNLFTCRVAMVVGSAAMLWIVPASAADLAVTACKSVTSEARPATAIKRAQTARQSFVVQRPTGQPDRTTSAQPDPQTGSGERNNSDIWYRRQFVVLMVGVAY